MDAVEQLLSDTADFLENGLAANIKTRQLASRLLAAGQSPVVVRLLDRECPGAEAVISIRKSSE